MLDEYQPGPDKWMTTKNPPFCAYSLCFLKDTASKSNSMRISFPLSLASNLAVAIQGSSHSLAVSTRPDTTPSACLFGCNHSIQCHSSWASSPENYSCPMEGLPQFSGSDLLLGAVIIRTSCQLLSIFLRGKKDVFWTKQVQHTQHL